MIKKVFITWEEVNRLLDTIHEQSKGEIDYVTGIPRGGTILAIMYSHRFDIPYFEYKSNHYPRLLIIDDIADSGERYLMITVGLFTLGKKKILKLYKIIWIFKINFLSLIKNES